MDIKNTICVLGVAIAAACSQQDNQTTAEEDKGASETLGGHTLGSSTDITTNAVDREQSELNKSDSGVGGPVQRESGNFQQRPLPTEASDEELAKSIRVAISTGSTGTTGVIAEDQLTKIQVTASNGQVTLSGPVASEDEKRIIEKQVSGLKGVKSVVNNLQVTTALPNDDKQFQPLVPRTPGNE